jgi:hypothetical protein
MRDNPEDEDVDVWRTVPDDPSWILSTYTTDIQEAVSMEPEGYFEFSFNFSFNFRPKTTKSTRISMLE